MNKELLNYKDYIIQLAILISQHSFANKENIFIKKSRVQYMFSILEYLQSKISEKTFEELILADSTKMLYNISTKSINVLKKENAYYLCASLSKGAYTGGVFKNYQYKNKIRLKNNKYAIQLSKITALLSEKEKRTINILLYENRNSTQITIEKEEEVIVKIDDVEEIE